MKEYILILAIFALGIIVYTFSMSLSDEDNIEKITYCHIDSISQAPKYEFSPELLTKYHTDCDITFSSTKEYHLGDSIQVKTIIIQ